VLEGGEEVKVAVPVEVSVLVGMPIIVRVTLAVIPGVVADGKVETPYREG
jgi:hypothetical protein